MSLDDLNLGLKASYRQWLENNGQKEDYYQQWYKQFNDANSPPKYYYESATGYSSFLPYGKPETVYTATPNDYFTNGDHVKHATVGAWGVGVVICDKIGKSSVIVQFEEKIVITSNSSLHLLDEDGNIVAFGGL